MPLRWIVNRLRWLWRYGLSLLLYALLMQFLLRSAVPITDLWHRIAYEVSAHQFDYIGWEVEAILAKAGQTLYGQHPFMTEAERSSFVREYVADLQRAQQLEAQIAQIFSDPNENDPISTSAEQQAERDSLRANLAQRQLTAEAILEGQVAVVLVDLGFGTLGQLLPPMAMHTTEVPNLLVTSPRDQIRMEISINLYPLPVDEIEAIEDRITERYNQAALIVPLGGIALYPAMILESTSIPRLAEVFAHEWLHHYLFFFPLGIHYFTDINGFSGDARTINETTADLFGKEVARLVLARYYPDLLPPDATSNPQAPTPNIPTQPPPFDFGRAMHQTRITVDALLHAGQVEVAERYMEERRALFYENGYRIRKLNQAFFAFYGGYQAGGIPGIAGRDPIGPAVRAVRDNSTDLHGFIQTMRNVTNRDTLLQLAYP